MGNRQSAPKYLENLSKCVNSKIRKIQLSYVPDKFHFACEKSFSNLGYLLGYHSGVPFWGTILGYHFGVPFGSPFGVPI